MKKNVIFWVGIKNEAHNDKYGNFDYFEYTKQSWKHFCERFDCTFVEFNQPIKEDLSEYRVNWQKAIYAFDVLDNLGIEYNQIALVDSTCMYKWDAPNFFELTEHKFTGWRDSDNLNWIYQSVIGYEPFFKFKLDISNYINSGFIIFNESHKKVMNSFKELYENNKQYFIDAQDKLIKKGTEQTPLNYWLQINKVDVKTDLPLPFKLTHLNRKDLFHYNWQLNEDTTPFFIKYGYNWIFNGIPKDARSNVLKQVWDMVSKYYTKEYLVLEQVNHKHQYKNSTSRKFKEDLITVFKGKGIKTCVEFGCCQGDTTKVLSTVFDTVYASDLYEDNVSISKEKCIDRLNIDFEVKDVNSEWQYENVDVIYLDALHDLAGIKSGLDRCQTQYPNAIIIMDDYGHEMNTVKPIIHELISENKIEVLHWIGENKGYKAANSKLFVDREGLIFKFK